MALPDLMHTITQTWYDIYITYTNQFDVLKCIISNNKQLVQ